MKWKRTGRHWFKYRTYLVLILVQNGDWNRVKSVSRSRALPVLFVWNVEVVENRFRFSVKDHVGRNLAALEVPDANVEGRIKLFKGAIAHLEHCTIDIVKSWQLALGRITGNGDVQPGTPLLICVNIVSPKLVGVGNILASDWDLKFQDCLGISAYLELRIDTWIPELADFHKISGEPPLSCP